MCVNIVRHSALSQFEQSYQTQCFLPVEVTPDKSCDDGTPSLENVLAHMALLFCLNIVL